MSLRGERRRVVKRMRMGCASTGEMVGLLGMMLVGVMRRLMIELVGLVRVRRLVGLVLRWMG
jgi:hypothetical protein